MQQIAHLVSTAERKANHWFLLVTWVMTLLATVSVLAFEGLHLWTWAAFQGALLLVPTLLHLMRRKEGWVKYIAAAALPISMFSASVISPTIDINWPIWFISMVAGAYYLTPAIVIESALLAFAGLFGSIMINPPETRGLPLAQFMSTGLLVMIAITGLTLAAAFRTRRIMSSLDQAAAMERMTLELQGAMAQVAASGQTVAATAGDLDQQGARLAGALKETATVVDALRQGFTQQERSLTEGMASIQRIAGAVEQLSAAATQQAGQVSSATSVVHQVSQSASETADLVGTVISDAQAASESARLGSRLVGQSAQATQQVEAAVDETASRLAQLSEHSQRIGSAAVLIQEIADQTSLLALNAAIEAARAGEQGRGFAVVADEVRKLADRSAAATREINEMVQRVEQGIGLSLEAMATTRNRVKASANQSTEMAGALTSILTATERTFDRMAVLKSRSSSMQHDAANLAANFSELAALAEENAASAEEMAAATEQMQAVAVGLQTIGQEAVALVAGVERSMADLRSVAADLGQTATRLVAAAGERGR